MVSELEGHLIEDGNLLSPETVAGEPISRQAQVERLRTFLAPMLRGEPAVNTWICGPPGSGKTLLARWATQEACGGAGTRVGVYVNCWQHRSLYSVLQAVIDELKILGAEAQDTNIRLDRVRQALRGRPFVVILDEIDRPMPAQREEIIYGLLGLPRCALACIANGTQALATMDERVRSHLSPVVIQLSLYSAKELEAILTDRARRALAPDSWTPAVLKRIAAAANGDARTAIQILRQAAATAEMSGNAKLTTRLVEQCLRPWHLVQQEARIASLSEHEKILFDQAKQQGPLRASELARRYAAALPKALAHLLNNSLAYGTIPPNQSGVAAVGRRTQVPRLKGETMDVLEAIRTRRSVRAYSPKAIPADVMDRMRNALRWAPSACNLQPWRFILVTGPDLRRQVAEASHHQLWMADAPVTIVACGLPDRAYQHMGGDGCSVEVDVAIAVDHMTLAATAEGLGTCWIGAFDEGAVKRLLGVPDGVKVVALTPLGYPASADLVHPVSEQKRRPAAEVFSIDRYNGPSE